MQVSGGDKSHTPGQGLQHFCCDARNPCEEYPLTDQAVSERCEGCVWLLHCKLGESSLTHEETFDLKKKTAKVVQFFTAQALVCESFFFFFFCFM